MDLAGLLGVARPNWAGATSVERRRIDKIDAAEREIRADAAKAERERIVAWLRDDEGSYDDINGRAARRLADVIESGEF